MSAVDGEVRDRLAKVILEHEIAHEGQFITCLCGHRWLTLTEHTKHIADAILAAGWVGQERVADVIAGAEQRGREDNSDHGTCYVFGSEALKMLRVAAWWAGHETNEHGKGNCDCQCPYDRSETP